MHDVRQPDSFVNLNRNQQAAVGMAIRAAERPGSVVMLKGPAGTGKSTALKAVDAEVSSRLLAPTGKAAARIRQILRKQAWTGHRLLYRPDEDEHGRVTFVQKTDEEILQSLGDARFLIVDEVSMMTSSVWGDIEPLAQRLGLSMMLVGDDFQLPPVSSDNFNAFDSIPIDECVELTEIFRQALDSPILKCATEIRTQRRWGAAQLSMRRHLPHVAPERLVETAASLTGEDFCLIAHRNETRLFLNNAIRAELGCMSPWPEAEEPLLVRRNSKALGVANGEVIAFDGYLDAFPELGWTDRIAVGGLEWRFTRVDGVRCAICPEAVMGRVPQPVKRQIEAMRAIDARMRIDATGDDGEPVPVLLCELGYALTAHASQGSEWPHVIVAVEPSLAVMSEIHRCQWAYTGITRGKTDTQACFYRLPTRLVTSG